MARGPATGESPVPPETAFAVLGNETRIDILHHLTEADGQLSFTELRNRVGVKQGSQFNYHLDKLVGHFVEKTEAGYTLATPGERVVQAILSGAVTDTPTIEPTPVESWSCPYCGGTVEVSYEHELVARYCTNCPGFRTGGTDFQDSRNAKGYLGSLSMPPAGVADRAPDDLLMAAFTWAYAEWLVAANGVCPRCSATIERTTDICEEHDAETGPCDRCGARQAISFRNDCTNCPFTQRSIASMRLAATTELLAFLTARGHNPLTDPWDWGWEYDEVIHSIDPLRADLTFTADGDQLTVTIDENLDILSATTPG